MLRSRRRGLGGLLAVIVVVAVALPALGTSIFVERFDADPFPPLPEPPPVEEPPPGEDPPEEPPPPEPLWDANWIDVRTADIDNTSVVSPGYIGDAVGVSIAAGNNRGTGARYWYPGDDDPDEAWFRYMLRLDNWNAAGDGKLPGFAGLYGSTARGCLPSTEASPGWSARIVFKADGVESPPGTTRLGYYVYHLDQPTSCGQTMLWDPGVVTDNRWYCVEGYARMNTPGQNDGELVGWLDGTEAIRWDGLAFRRESEDFMHIREFWLNVFYGGTAATPNDLHLSLDQLVVSDSGRVGCPDPFWDDNGSVHEPALTELKALGVYHGCSSQVSCFEDELSRWAMAVLVDRALGLAPTSEDFFTDDDELWARGHIDRLAAAGITNGCEPGLFCPEDSITRAEFAVMLRRAFSFPDATTDYFADDDGHWAEAAFNSLAEAGVTLGCREAAFCPDDVLTRGQAASLLLRAIDWRAAG